MGGEYWGLDSLFMLFLQRLFHCPTLFLAILVLPSQVSDYYMHVLVSLYIGRTHALRVFWNLEAKT